MFPLHVTWSSPAVASLAAALYVLLAAIVTIDILLKKSDVRSALGWIGAVWLAPIQHSAERTSLFFSRMSMVTVAASRM